VSKVAVDSLRVSAQTPGWLSPAEQHAWRSFMRLRQTLGATLVRDLQAHSKLSDADHEILVALTDAPHGRQRFQELAKSVDWEQSRLSHQVTRMIKHGLVAREEFPRNQDRRLGSLTAGRTTCQVRTHR
jgi:DNA-binding MarR family transcriptional regulator